MKVTRQQWAILSSQVNEHLDYFAKLADRVTHTDLIHDAAFGEAAHKANNAVKALAELLAERVKSGYEFETPPGAV